MGFNHNTELLNSIQIDLTGALPTEEVFWLNFEEGYFACQG